MAGLAGAGAAAHVAVAAEGGLRLGEVLGDRGRRRLRRCRRGAGWAGRRGPAPVGGGAGWAVAWGARASTGKQGGGPAGGGPRAGPVGCPSCSSSPPPPDSAAPRRRAGG